MKELIERLYAVTLQLPRFNCVPPFKNLVRNGIYLFYETGESIEYKGQSIDRIVRVGTHKSEGGFCKRIRQHFCNKNGSVFRRHLGGALLARNDPNDPRIPTWLTQKTTPDQEIEERVSALLRDRFTFACLAVETKEERLTLERGLIALLAQQGNQNSEKWLGRWAISEAVRQSSLWNTQQVDAEPLTVNEFERLERAISITLEERAR